MTIVGLDLWGRRCRVRYVWDRIGLEGGKGGGNERVVALRLIVLR